MERQNNRPVAEFKVASVRASVWLNQNDDGQSWYKVTITRMLPAGSERRETTHFRPDDLPLVVATAQLAQQYIWDRKRETTFREPDEAASEE